MAGSSPIKKERTDQNVTTSNAWKLFENYQVFLKIQKKIRWGKPGTMDAGILSKMLEGDVSEERS